MKSYSEERRKQLFFTAFDEIPIVDFRYFKYLSKVLKVVVSLAFSVDEVLQQLLILYAQFLFQQK